MRDVALAMSTATGTRRALIVDDEPTVRALVARIIERAGFAVATAANGRDAIARIEADGAPDLVVSDVMMPEMDGIALWGVMKVRWPHVPLVLMSGRDHAALHETGDLEPELLQKPLTSSTVLLAVERALARASAVAAMR